MKSHLDESRNAVAIVGYLFRNDPLKAAQMLEFVEDGDGYVAALQALCVRLLQVVDEIAFANGLPDYSADHLLNQLTSAMAQDD